MTTTLLGTISLLTLFSSHAFSCVDITTKSADPTGVAYSDAAFTAAVNVNPNHVCICAPAGVYKFQSRQTI